MALYVGKIFWRPFDSDNVIVFGAGALVGTFAPAVWQISIGTAAENLIKFGC